MFGGSLEALSHVLGQINQAAGVTPLVVVPRNNLHLITDDLRQVGIEDGGMGITDNVGGNQWFAIGVFEDSLQRSLSCLLQGSVHGLYGNLLLRLEGEVGQEPVITGTRTA